MNYKAFLYFNHLQCWRFPPCPVLMTAVNSMASMYSKSPAVLESSTLPAQAQLMTCGQGYL